MGEEGSVILPVYLLEDSWIDVILIADNHLMGTAHEANYDTPARNEACPNCGMILSARVPTLAFRNYEAVYDDGIWSIYRLTEGEEVIGATPEGYAWTAGEAMDRIGQLLAGDTDDEI